MSFDFYLEYKANSARILREMQAEDRRRRAARREARRVLWSKFWRVALPVLLAVVACSIFAALGLYLDEILKETP
jgi:anti-sigma-K factor RskA